jgi:hypothetical protein
VGFLSRLLGRRDAGDDDTDDGESRDAGATEEIRPGDPTEDGGPPDPRQGVTVWLKLSDPTFESSREQMKVFAVEDRLMRALDASGAGTHDTNTLARGSFGIRFAGDDADAIVEAIRPLIADLPPGTYVTKRPGPSGTSEERVDL